MARGHKHLPIAEKFILRKSDILQQLFHVDSTPQARQRALDMDSIFRTRTASHVGSLPAKEAKFQKFFTSPYVLMMHAMKNRYSRISDIEHDILPAKLFSSMETSAGRMVEDIALPAYGWENVRSSMHTANSALDGKKVVGNKLNVVTLKSGPRCLNDEMSENFADTILNNAVAWAHDAGVRKIDFSYGVLYGTQKTSNKKDWHILRNLAEKHGESNFSETHRHRWGCIFEIEGIEVETTIRIGKDWWRHLGGETCLTELAVALIRACVPPGDIDPPDHQYIIRDLHEIVSMDCVPSDFNTAILQHSQIPWLFFFMRHFCDELVD